MLLLQEEPTRPALQLSQLLGSERMGLLIYYSTVSILGLPWLREWRRHFKVASQSFLTSSTRTNTNFGGYMTLTTGPSLVRSLPKGNTTAVWILWRWQQAKKITWNFPSYSWARFLYEVIPGKIGKVPSERKIWRPSPCPLSLASTPYTLLHTNPSGLAADWEIRKLSSALTLQSILRCLTGRKKKYKYQTEALGFWAQV